MERMRRIALLGVVVLGLSGSGVVSAAPSGVSRQVVASGVSGDVSIEAEGPVEVRHAIVTIEPGGTTDWISWPGSFVVTVKSGDLEYRNASEQDCAARATAAGTSFVIAPGTVFEVVNPGSQPAEVHTVAFLPPGGTLALEDQPANC